MASSVVDSELETLIRARYPIIYIVSWEEKRVEDALRAIAQNRGKKIYFWTITQGMVLNPNAQDSATRDPMNALNFVMDSREQALFVLKDYHPFISEVSVTRRLRDLTVALKMSYKTLIILAPLLKLPNELEKEITVVDYGLPDRDDLDRLLEGIIQSVKDNPQINTGLTDLERDQVLKAAQGLTANEAENVFAKSLVEKHQFDVDVILGEKEQIIRKSGILEYYPFSEKIGDVGGLDLLKDWMEKRTVAFTEKARAFGLPEPRGVLLLGVQGCGKCFEKDTPILMFDGEVKAVQDVVAGDLVMGPDSRPRRVLSTTSGHDEMFRVTPTKGDAYVVNADHILTLRLSGSHRAYKQADAQGIINIPIRDYLTQSACFKQRCMGYRASVEFPARPVPLDPYFLGVWLGDGSEKTPSVTTADEIIVEHVTETASLHGLNVRRAEKSNCANRAATYFLTAGNQGRPSNPVLIALRDLGVLGNKHIPLLYRANSREVRLRLLAGIVDTDGCFAGNDYEIIQKRKRLADDIVFVARSLGLAAYVRPCQKSCLVNGMRFTGTYYRIHISGDTDMIPVRLHSKQAYPRQQRKNVLNTGIRVEPIGPGDYYGFAVDGDHRFLLGDFTVVHNSLSAKAIGSLWRLPLLRLDVGRIFAGIVGSSEENMRKAIRVAESVAPCVAGDSRVLLADGSERTIESLYEGNETELTVLSMTEDWQIRPTAVRAITRRPAPDLYTIQLKHSCLQATSNHLHPVLRDGALHWGRTDELKTTDYVAVFRWATQPPGEPEVDSALDTIPVGLHLRRIRLEMGIDSRHLRPEDRDAVVNRYERNQGHPSRECLRVIVAEMRAWAEQRGLDTSEVEALQKLVDSPIAWSQVVSVQAEETPEFVYDLVCPEPHNYICNNAITHNCVLWLDELEKGFSGTQSSGMSDGGTTARVFGTFLTWMQDKKAAAFVVATSNDVTSLPPELLRKGRFDEIFFIDLPDKGERKQIFNIHLRKRKRNPDDFDLDQLAAATPGFSGAEIEAVVVEALYDAFDEVRELTTESIIEAAHNSVPLSMTMSERIEELRMWAETRARAASSAQSEDMNTIREELMVAKATDPTTHQIDPAAVKLKNALPPPPPEEDE